MTKDDARGSPAPGMPAASQLRGPFWVYDIWSAYSHHHVEGRLPLDDIRLTEDLALVQLAHIDRLKEQGVRFDAYMMNAYWHDPDGAYRSWSRRDWPNGPDRWIAQCQERGLQPGLWFGTNWQAKLRTPPAWADSLADFERENPHKLVFFSLFEGGFLADFMQVLQHWYDRGIRIFELDYANLRVATPAGWSALSAEEIHERNKAALHCALNEFRQLNPQAMLAAFNDFGGDFESTSAPFPFRNAIDLRWLEVFETMYSGDTRVSDVALASFWRSVDLYNDHMVRRYGESGVPLARCDPFFTLSRTWFGYCRGNAAWKSMLILTAARGTWKKTIYGDLSVLGEADARWFAKVQALYEGPLARGRTQFFGGVPGNAEPYGFVSPDVDGALCAVVNPTLSVRPIELPRLHHLAGRILFHDAGFVPRLEGNRITLGPGQMALAGFGRLAAREFDLGEEEDVRIPASIRLLDAQVRGLESGGFEATVAVPASGSILLLCQQRKSDGAPAKNASGKGIVLTAEQAGRTLPIVQHQPDVSILTGASWSAGTVRREDLQQTGVVRIKGATAFPAPVSWEVRAYCVE